MALGFAERYRGARHIEWFAMIALVALAVLLMTGRTRTEAKTPPKSDTEARLEQMLSQLSGVEAVSVMIAQNDQGKATGVLVTARSIRDIRTYLQIQQAVATLLDVEIDRIEIVGDGWGGGL